MESLPRFAAVVLTVATAAALIGYAVGSYGTTAAEQKALEIDADLDQAARIVTMLATEMDARARHLCDLGESTYCRARVLPEAVAIAARWTGE